MILDSFSLRCTKLTAERICLFTLTVLAVALPPFLEASQVVKYRTIQGQN